MKKFIGFVIVCIVAFLSYNAFVSADDEGEDGVDPGTVQSSNPAVDWVMSQNLTFKGEPVKLYPNSDLQFELTAQSGTRYNSILGMNIPVNELTITSKNNTPVTVVKIYINRGQCGVSTAFTVGDNFYIPNFKFGKSYKLRVDGKDCDVVEVAVVTLNNGFIVYSMQ